LLDKLQGALVYIGLITA